MKSLPLSDCLVRFLKYSMDLVQISAIDEVNQGEGSYV